MNNKTFLNAPELHIGIVAFFLHFVWELIQTPLYECFRDMHYYTVVLLIIRATLGDVLISLAAFWSASVAVRSRFWIIDKGKKGLWVFLGMGMLITVVFEELATGPLNLWEYADAMPILPILGTGLAPVAQWVILPLLQLWFVRRQLLGGSISGYQIQ